MTDEQRNMKDMEQDTRLNSMDIEIASIKSVTHGSDLHNWDGIVAEHGKLVDSVQAIQASSGMTARIMAGLAGAATLAGTIYGVIKLFA